MRYRPPKALEKKVERDFVAWVKVQGGITRKLNGAGNRAWPDQLVTTGYGAKFMVEFKRVGEKTTKLQDDLHDQLINLDWAVFICDDLEEAKFIYTTENEIWAKLTRKKR